MKWTFNLVLFASILGCSSSPNYYDQAPTVCQHPACAVSAIVTGVLKSEKPSQKCSDLTGTRKEECKKQVDSLNKSLEKHTK